MAMHGHARPIAYMGIVPHRFAAVAAVAKHKNNAPEGIRMFRDFTPTTMRKSINRMQCVQAQSSMKRSLSARSAQEAKGSNREKCRRQQDHRAANNAVPQPSNDNLPAWGGRSYITLSPGSFFLRVLLFRLPPIYVGFS